MITSLALSFRDVRFDVIDRSGQPWLRGYQIGTALEYTNQPDAAIRKIYDRNADEFTDAMTALVELETNGGKQQVRIFSLRGCHLLGMLARTKIAKEFRKWVLDILDRETNAFTLTPPNVHSDLTLIPSEQQTLSEIVHRKAESVPKKLVGKALAEIWSRVHRKFRVSKYEQIPRTQLTDAILYVIKLELKTGAKEALKNETPKALPLDIHYPLESAAPPLGCSGLSHYVFSAANEWVDPNWELLMKLKDAGYNVEGPIYSHQAKIHVIAGMRKALTDKIAEIVQSATISLPYAPIYLR